MDEKWAGKSKTTQGAIVQLVTVLAVLAGLPGAESGDLTIGGLTIEQLIAGAFGVGGFLYTLFGRKKAQSPVWFVKRQGGQINAPWIVGVLAIVLASATLASCGSVGRTVEDELTEEVKAQLTPEHERYIVLANAQSWTKLARAYAAKEFCDPPAVVSNCAEPNVVIALDEILQRLKPTVESLRQTAKADEITRYTNLASTLLLQLQAELARVLAEEAN